MSTFHWNGDTHPMPAGWTGMSIEDWFYKLESARDRIMNADELDLPQMVDEDGDALDPEEVVLIHELGFRSGGHWEAFRSWGVASWAAHVGLSSTDCEFRYGGIARERMMAEKGAAMTTAGGGGGGALDPVDGVDLQQWARIQAAIASGGDSVALVAAAGIDRARWDRASAEWNNRMATDTTFAVATAYGNAFASAGQGQFGAAASHAASVGVAGDLGPEPISFERYVEIEQAMNAAAMRGQDVNAWLNHFGMTVVDWSNVSMWWTKRMQQEATRYHEVYIQYSDHFRAHYGG